MPERTERKVEGGIPRSGTWIDAAVDAEAWVTPEELPARLRTSAEYVVVEDHLIPRTIELSANGVANGGADPETYARIEVNVYGVPRLTALTFTATDPDSPGIRQTDLREVEVRALVEDLVAGFTFYVDREHKLIRVPVQDEDGPSPAYIAARRFVGDLRAGGGARAITDDLLDRVAKVYRDNIATAPTKAVQHHFQVSQRMAAEYVSRARKAGKLPPTKRGKKNA